MKKKDIVWKGSETKAEETETPVANTDIPPTSADAVLAELTKRGYDVAAQLRYCRAARSWTKKGSEAWSVYLECEKRTEEKPSG